MTANLHDNEVTRREEHRKGEPYPDNAQKKKNTETQTCIGILTTDKHKHLGWITGDTDRS